MAQRQAKEIDRLQTIVDRFGAKASKASMAHSIEKRIDRMAAGAVDAPKANRSVHVRFPPPPAPGRTVLEAADLPGRYGQREGFRGAPFTLDRAERLLLMGLNGRGTTRPPNWSAGGRSHHAHT